MEDTAPSAPRRPQMAPDQPEPRRPVHAVVGTPPPVREPGADPRRSSKEDRQSVPPPIEEKANTEYDIVLRCKDRVAAYRKSKPDLDDKEASLAWLNKLHKKDHDEVDLVPGLMDDMMTVTYTDYTFTRTPKGTHHGNLVGKVVCGPMSANKLNTVFGGFISSLVDQSCCQALYLLGFADYAIEPGLPNPASTSINTEFHGPMKPGVEYTVIVNLMNASTAKMKKFHVSVLDAEQQIKVTSQHNMIVVSYDQNRRQPKAEPRTRARE